MKQGRRTNLTGKSVKLTWAALISALMLLAFAPPAPAAPQGPWVLPATDTSATGRNAFIPQIAIAPDGTATAIWSRSNGSNEIIQAATRPPGGSFGAAVDLSATGQNAFDPQVAIAPDGTATAIWSRSNGSNEIIQAATRPPGGSFGAAVDLSATGQNAFGPQIAIAPDGVATAVWVRLGATNIIQAATRPPGGSFGAAVNLSAAGQDAFDPQIAIAPDGTATAVWRRFNGTNEIIQAATRPPGGSFGAAVNLSAAGQNAFQPQIAFAPDGTATAIWRGSNGTNDIIQAATRPPGGSFGAAVNLSATGQDAFGPQIAIAPDGVATAVWYRSNGSNEIIQGATRPPGGSFGAAVDLSAAGQNAFQPQIAFAPDGAATAVWYRFNGAHDIIQTATRPPGGSFGAAVDLSATGQDAFDPQIAIAPDGAATAVWARFNGANEIIQSASTVQPSFILQVERAGSGTGTVTSTPAGISCGADCQESYPSFTKVTLTATPSPGSTFTGWSGAGCSGTGTCEVTLLDAATVTATFATIPAPVQRTLTATKAGTGSGSVTSSPSGIDCGGTCSQAYNEGTVVTLTATPSPGSTFTGWSGAGCSGTGTCQVTLLDATTVSATFQAARLSSLKISPKSTSAKPGSKVTFKVRVKNTGLGIARNLKVCAKAPKRLVKPIRCARVGSLAAGQSRTVKIVATVKRGAKKGNRARLTFTATATGASKKTGRASIRVR